MSTYYTKYNIDAKPLGIGGAAKALPIKNI